MHPKLGSHTDALKVPKFGVAHGRHKGSKFRVVEIAGTEKSDADGAETLTDPSPTKCSAQRTELEARSAAAAR